MLEYQYDSLNRLVKADMISDYFGEYSDYTMTYSPSGMVGIKSCDDMLWIRNKYYGQLIIRTVMKKIFLVCLLFLFQSLDAKQIEIEVQEVELNSKLIGIISSFIEYSQVCEDAKNVDYILSLYMRCPPKAIKDSADTKLAIEFYPDELDFHLYEVPKYISRIKILDSVCNVYIRMSLEVEQLWSNYQDYGIFTLSDNYVNIVHRTEDECNMRI